MAYTNIVDEHLLVVDISLELEAWDYVPTTPQPGQIFESQFEPEFE